MADRAGFEAFYAGHLPRVVRACALVLLDRAEAEDVAAEAFARLWSHWGRIHGDDHAGGYVFTTAMRLCSKRRRRAAREVVGTVPERGAAADPTDREAVIDALRTLPLRQRQSVVLRDWAGFPTHDVARFLGAKESTVRVHLARGRAALRERLTAFGFEEVGRPFSLDMIASEEVFREQPEMLRFILDSIEISEAG